MEKKVGFEMGLEKGNHEDVEEEKDIEDEDLGNLLLVEGTD